MLFYYSVAKVNIIKLKQLTKSLFFYTTLDFCSKLLYLCEIIIKSETENFSSETFKTLRL
jgi:hypothetical protein